VRADIVGTFADKNWAKAAKKLFEDLGDFFYIGKLEDKDDNFNTHPANYERVEYLGQMVKYS